MNLYKISTEDKCEALEKISRLFSEEKKPAIILYDNKSKLDIIDHFLTYYDVILKEVNDGKKPGNIVTYSKEDLPLALMAFPLFINKKAIFIEKSRLSSYYKLHREQNVIFLGENKYSDFPYKITKNLKTKEDIIKFAKKSTSSTLVIINSCDLYSKETPFITDYKCPSLSILGSYIAAIRGGIIYDVSSLNPSGKDIENTINSSPEYKEVNNIIAVGTPGSLPFVQTELPDFVIGYNWKTDSIRDYTLWSGDYIKAAQGRIQGINILDASLLFQRSFLTKKLRPTVKLKGISSSDSVTCLEEMGAAAEVPTLRTSACLMSKNLKKSAWDIKELYGKDNRYSNILENLKDSLLCYIGNHGILLYIRCAEKCLGAGDLPLMPPAQIYCFSCITTRTTGLWLSSNEIDWNYSDVPPERNIPLMSIRQGVSSFTGMLMCGLEVEGDILVSEIMKNMQSGYSLGEAVKEAKNTLTASVKTSLMMMEDEWKGNYELSKFYSQLTVYECEIYGDPSIKFPGKIKPVDHVYIDAEFILRNKLNISINIPDSSWEEIELPVGEKSQKMYYTKKFRTFYPATPFSVLAGSMPVEKDPESFIAKESIGYYNFKINIKLLGEEKIKYVELKNAELLDATDFDGNKLDPAGVDPFEVFGYGRLRTSIYKDPLKVNLRHNWPFAVNGNDLYIFIPTAMVMDESKIIARLKSASFTVHYSKKGAEVRGKIISSEGLPVNAFLTFNGKEGKKRVIDTDNEGNYSIILPSDTYSLIIESDLHSTYKDEVTVKQTDIIKDVVMVSGEKVPVTLQVLDGTTDKPLEGAHVRFLALFGPRDRKMIEDYVKGKERYPHKFVTEMVTDSSGKIENNLVTGDYIVDIYRKKDSGKGAMYLRKEELLEVRKENKENVYKLDQAGTIFGQILDKDRGEGIPDATVIVKVSTETEGKEKNLRFHTDMKGNFGAVVPAEQKLLVLGIFEGCEMAEENNYGKGIVLHKGETTEVRLTCKRKF